ncbi:MAG: hypothetical protein D6785_05535 [Planctomycetota bacterium]|nr:MAG: hypothetical protein D6785_05535 [Planctomycetota bacterium]
MNLRSKRELVARMEKVGKDRVRFVRARMEDIKEAITKQDLRELISSGAIIIKPVKGRRKRVKRKNRRGPGKIRKKINTRKRDYVIMTRKLRAYSKAMKKQGVITREEYKEIRKKIRNRFFKSKANLKSYIENLRK